jgi:hypothetical protein
MGGMGLDGYQPFFFIILHYDSLPELTNLSYINFLKAEPDSLTHNVTYPFIPSQFPCTLNPLMTSPNGNRY